MQDSQETVKIKRSDAQSAGIVILLVVAFLLLFGMIMLFAGFIYSFFFLVNTVPAPFGFLLWAGIWSLFVWFAGRRIVRYVVLKLTNAKSEKDVPNIEIVD